MSSPALHLKKLCIVLIILLGLLSCENFFNKEGRKQIEVSVSMAGTAAELATEQIGDPYVWGGDGPDNFDCSGLIVWAYQEVVGRDYIFSDGTDATEAVDDVTMQMFYDYNVVHIDASQVVPGDIIFITYVESLVTHGGIVSDITDTSVEFVNASSYHGQVVSDEWGLQETVRDQWIVGYGRLKYWE